MSIGSKEMEETFDLAVETFKDYLKENGKTTGDKARLAQAFIASACKIKASEQSNQSMKMSFFAKIAKDKEELKEYIRITNPGYVPAIEGPKAGIKKK